MSSKPYRLYVEVIITENNQEKLAHTYERQFYRHGACKLQFEHLWIDTVGKYAEKEGVELVQMKHRITIDGKVDEEGLRVSNCKE
jgi:hypothetical protein